MSAGRSRIAATIGIAVLAVTLVLPASATTEARVDWLRYGFDQQRTGYNPAETTLGTGNVGGLRLLWSASFDSIVETSPVLAAGVAVNGSPRDLLYAGDEHGNFSAIDANTGAVVWSRNLGFVNTACGDIPVIFISLRA